MAESVVDQAETESRHPREGNKKRRPLNSYRPPGWLMGEPNAWVAIFPRRTNTVLWCVIDQGWMLDLPVQSCSGSWVETGCCGLGCSQGVKTDRHTQRSDGSACYLSRCLQLTSNIEHGDQQAQQPPSSRRPPVSSAPRLALTATPSAPGGGSAPVGSTAADGSRNQRRPGQWQTRDKAHEDDEHFRTEDIALQRAGKTNFRTEDSSCRGRGNTRLALHSGHVRDRDPGRRFPLRREEMNETETTFCRSLSAVARIGLVAVTFY